MLSLILTACLTVPSYACRESVLPIVEEMNELQCMMGAQAKIATWSEEHPKWRVVRWRCQHETLAQNI